MIRPSQWALVALVAASAALGGCRGPRGCLEGCDTAGAGGQSGHPHGPGTLDSCPMARACPHVQTVSSVSIQNLGSTIAGSAQLGNAIETPVGPAVSWVMSPGATGVTGRVGVAFPEQDQVVALDVAGLDSGTAQPPAVFQRDGEVDLVPAPFDHVIPISLDTMQAGDPVPLDLGSGTTPAVAGMGQAVAALVAPGPALRYFGLALGDPLLTMSLGNQQSPSPLALAPTCNGLVASWGSHAAAFTPLGDRAAETVDTGLTPQPGHAQHVVWDGGEVVVSGDNGVVELDSKGKQLSRTPVAMGPAVGTEDGLLTIDSGPASSQVVIRARKSGNIVKSYGAASNAIVPGTVVVANRYIYFIEVNGSSVKVLSVVCNA